MTKTAMMLGLTTAAGAALVSRSARADWVMGTVELNSGSFYTEIEAVYQVPTAPTSSNATTSLWPGLEDQDGDLIQPVLVFNEDNNGVWTMHNEVATTSGGGVFDAQTTVNAGDWIVALAYLDTSNPGNGCNQQTGAHCNYMSYWADWTLGVSAYMSQDWPMAEGPTVALGTVLENPAGNYASCSDFPSGGLPVTTYLYQNGSSGLFTQVTPNYTLEVPGDSSPFQFTDPGINGGPAYPTCINATYPWAGDNSTAMFWLNAF